jgi:hypothetical protein
MAIDSVRWDFGDGTMSNGITVSHNYAANGNYTACATAYNSCGYSLSCKAVNIVIADLPDVRGNNGSPMITIAPNPFSDNTVFQLSNYGGNPYSISLVNMIGQTVWSRSNVTEDKIAIERGSLPAGIYYYQVRIQSEQMVVGKLVIE